MDCSVKLGWRRNRTPIRKGVKGDREAPRFRMEFAMIMLKIIDSDRP